MDNPLFAAFDRERALREEAYLGVPHNICGIPCRQITPRLLAILFRIQTPYLTGAEVRPEHTLQFLWAVDRNNPFKKERPRLLRRSKRQQFDDFVAKDFDYDEAELEIDQWLEDTFMDAPEGKPSRAYVCSIAWIQYAMHGNPWGWSKEYTLDQPLRIIYQQLRCKALDNGVTIANRLSGGLVQGALDELNSPEAMEKRAAQVAEFSKRYREKIERDRRIEMEGEN